MDDESGDDERDGLTSGRGGESRQNSRWRTAAILKIDISPYLSEKSPDFHKILYTAADLELDEHHVIKKLHWTDSEFDRTYFCMKRLCPRFGLGSCDFS